MKEKFKHAYMDTARRFAELSPAKRMHVGAIVVKDDRIISIGYNGMPVGWDNECEHKEYMNAAKAGFMSQEAIEERFPYTEFDPKVDAHRRYRLVTKDEVLHAESNAIAKLAKSNDSGLGASLFVTHSPCIHCAKLILQSGIGSVYYGENYRDDAGLKFLERSGITVEQINVQS
jgi:dCMP deaminase